MKKLLKIITFNLGLVVQREKKFVNLIVFKKGFKVDRNPFLTEFM